MDRDTRTINAASLGMEAVAMLGDSVMFSVPWSRTKQEVTRSRDGIANNEKEGDRVLHFVYIQCVEKLLLGKPFFGFEHALLSSKICWTPKGRV